MTSPSELLDALEAPAEARRRARRGGLKDATRATKNKRGDGRAEPGADAAADPAAIDPTAETTFDGGGIGTRGVGVENRRSSGARECPRRPPLARAGGADLHARSLGFFGAGL